MMRRTLGLGCLLLSLLAFACNGSANQDSGSKPDQGPVYDPDTTGAKPIQSFEEVVEERQAAGDTFALDHQILEDMILDSIQGFELEVKKSATFKTGEFTFSEATKVFYNTQEDYIEIVAGDYVANPDFILVLLERHNLAQNVTYKGVTDRKLAIPSHGNDMYFFAWESYNENRRLAHMNIAVDYRYLVSISVSGREGFLEQAEYANWIDWAGLPGESPN